MSKPAAPSDVAVIASALALPVDGGAPAKRFRIVPFGTFGGRDGRGPWQLRDKAHAEQVIAATTRSIAGTIFDVDAQGVSVTPATARLPALPCCATRW